MLVEMRDDRPASQSARYFHDQAGGRAAGVAKRTRGCGPPGVALLFVLLLISVALLSPDFTYANTQSKSKNNSRVNNRL
jgi:hypothetical protein